VYGARKIKVIQQRGDNFNLFSTQMHAPEATTPSASILATKRSLRPRQRGGSFNLCNTRMNAPAATTFSASQPVTRLPEQPTRLQQRGNSFNLYGARMHAPAATTSSAYRLATSSLDSDTRPGGHCAHGSGATVPISAILGCMPLRPLYPRHSTLQPA
jgi:hypothetical protein